METQMTTAKALQRILFSGMILTACTFGLPSCGDDYDDTGVRSDIENLENRVSALEQWQKTANTNIQSLQGLVQALETRNYITGVETVSENGKNVGYKISFQNGNPITIYHGKDGANGANGTNGTNGTNGNDGVTPVIGVEKDTDNIYYWTVNGEFLKDTDGNKIPTTGPKGDTGATGQTGTAGSNGTNGTNGTDGKDGITPQVRINPDTNF